MTLFDEPEMFQAEAGANRLAEQLALAMAEARRNLDDFAKKVIARY